MATPSISVVIPLYNKEREIGAALRSVLAQTLPPVEIVVINDGSTDHSERIVREIADESASKSARDGALEGVHKDAQKTAPPIILISQANAGVAAARNRAICCTRGEYIALLDADDEWRPGFLAEIASMIGEFPQCGLYSTSFDVAGPDGMHPAPAPAARGIVENFFRDSAHRYIAIPSTSVIPRRVLDTVGGFPEGMKIGEDLHLWIRIASLYEVCFSPARLAVYSKTASNRSSSIYTPEKTAHSFEELYNLDAPADYNEFVARAALGKALIISVKGGTEEAARAARFFGYTRTYRRTLRKVRILNALPVKWRARLLNLYNAAAWRLARKGL